MKQKTSRSIAAEQPEKPERKDVTQGYCIWPLVVGKAGGENGRSRSSSSERLAK